jgi:hypothetical protein
MNFSDVCQMTKTFISFSSKKHTFRIFFAKFPPQNFCKNENFRFSPTVSHALRCQSVKVQALLDI